MNKFGMVFITFLSVGMAQVQVPDTPAGKWVKDYLETYNRFDSKVYSQFYTQRFDPRILQRFGGIERSVKELGFEYMTQGPLELHSVQPINPTQIVALVRRTMTQTWVNLEITVDPQNPQRLLSMLKRESPAPDGVSSFQPKDSAEFGRILENQLQKLNQNRLFSGVVMVAKDGNPIFNKAFGKRNTANQLLEPSNKFPLSSMGKMFTAIAIARLVEQGKLKYSDLVSTYLPDYPAERIDKITIGQLLSHTSGLGGFDFAQIVPMTSVEQMLQLNVEPNVFKPGERFFYSNMGYILLGAVIERVSGEDYFDHLKKNIFQPIGMNDTGNFAINETTPGFATGFIPDIDLWYTSGKLEWRSNADIRLARANPSGDMISTAADLLRFANALREGKLVKPQTFSLMTTPKSQVPYGYGFEVFPDAFVGLSGGGPGQNSILAMDLKRGYTVIILANQDQAAHNVLSFVNRLTMSLPPV